jgi:hypothetical protein
VLFLVVAVEDVITKILIRVKAYQRELLYRDGLDFVFV